MLHAISPHPCPISPYPRILNILKLRNLHWIRTRPNPGNIAFACGMISTYDFSKLMLHS